MMRLRLSVLMKKTFICFMFVFVSILFVGCSDTQITTAVNNYGESNAYDQYSGQDIILGTNDVEYYLNVSGEYETAAEYGISKANSVSSQVSFSVTSSSTTSFKFYASTTLSNPAQNTLTRSGSSIIASKIYFNSNSTYSILPLAVKKHIAMHELGHTFGLIDIYDSRMEGYSIMYGYMPLSGTYLFSDYQDFDKYNITWKYGE